MKTQVENRKLRTSLWLVNLLRIHKDGLTMDEINQKYKANVELSGGSPFVKTTFQNYKNAIFDMFGIQIACSKSTLRHRIDLEDENELANWLVNSFSVGRLVQEQQDVRDRILLEPTPAGMQFFNIAVEAIRTQTSLSLTYQKFADDEPYVCTLDPYALKLDEGRWYLLARKDKKDHLQVFAFDRIKDLQIKDGQTFQFELPFDPATHFANSFGVFTSPAPETIKVRVYGKTYNYLHTKPLHASQKEKLMAGNPENGIDNCMWEFTYHLCPSIDFQNELLRWGAGVEVMEPKFFREAIAKELKAAGERY